MDVAAAVLAGNRLALARLLTQVENDTVEGRQALDALFPFAGHAHVVGVTGAPGTGKSSLVNQLARCFRKPEVDFPAQRVGILAIDPSSPFTGGAILGDRLRMRDLSGDPDVFIRSVATRGALGGLARSTAGLTQALDAAGFEIVIIETVGAGQAEVDIARLTHTTLVVEAPGLGDDIQAIKAGLLEIADIMVLNKADLPGAEAAGRALNNMLQLAQITASAPPKDGWSVPLLHTVATQDKGIAALFTEILRHRQHLIGSGEWQKRERSRLQAELDRIIQDSLVRRWRGSLSEVRYQAALEHLLQREVSPGQAARDLLEGDVS